MNPIPSIPVVPTTARFPKYRRGITPGPQVFAPWHHEKKYFQQICLPLALKFGSLKHQFATKFMLYFQIEISMNGTVVFESWGFVFGFFSIGS